jgi:hypothetical protein
MQELETERWIEEAGFMLYEYIEMDWVGKRLRSGAFNRRSD